MGLDMYLTKRVYVGANYSHRKITGEIELETDGKKIPVDLSKVTYIEERQAYWRKANQIHRWFVENVQEGNDDCRDYDVSCSDLQDLVELCKKVLADKGLAEELLPTGEGDFFGSQDYGDWYFDDLKYTIDALSNLDDKAEYSYCSSW